jgi:hypothetical protein
MQLWKSCEKINLPVSHGSYVNNKPMMNQWDCMPIENVPDFGICSSPSNQNSATVSLVGEDGNTVTGKPCVPAILSCWMDTMEVYYCGWISCSYH